MILTGSQIILCDLPVRFDNYKGCTHDCKYCFAKFSSKKYSSDFNKIKFKNSTKYLSRFISGYRNQLVNWCDWNIPLHWGGVSDPFQPIEAEIKSSLKHLYVLKETYYPFVVSTKGVNILSSKEYLDVIKDCNAVIQISMTSPKLDSLEPGAPSFNERLKRLEILSQHCKRLIIRVQPYYHECLQDVIQHLKIYKNAGVYGITIEGIKFKNKVLNTEKVFGDYCLKYNILKYDYELIRDSCHKYGLKFYSADNRFRSMGDDLCCCGIDGLDGFKPHKLNFNHVILNKETITDACYDKKGSGAVFKIFYQTTLNVKFAESHSYRQMFGLLLKTTYKNIVK